MKLKWRKGKDIRSINSSTTSGELVIDVDALRVVSDWVNSCLQVEYIQEERWQAKSRQR
jgi:hypothetical protein